MYEAAEHGPLIQSLILLNKSKVIVEVGVAAAQTTNSLCHGAKAVGGFVYGYDLWDTHGLRKQFHHGSSMEYCIGFLQSQGHTNFELTKIDSTSEEFKTLIPKKHPKIDLAFIDGCHSYPGVKNDFEVIYPQLADDGIIVFHDTQRIDGPREFMIDLRTKFWDGTYDIVDFPYGDSRRVGVSLLVKRSYATVGLPLDEICNLDDHSDLIYAKEKEWYRQEQDRVAQVRDSLKGLE